MRNRSTLSVPSRRGLLRVIPALLCAPAIVRVESLMPVKAPPAEFTLAGYTRIPNHLLTIDAITREAIKLFCQTNEILRGLDASWWPEQYTPHLRVRLPSDYRVA